jgi:hypothetical protein
MTKTYREEDEAVLVVQQVRGEHHAHRQAHGQEEGGGGDVAGAVDQQVRTWMKSHNGNITSGEVAKL